MERWNWYTIYIGNRRRKIVINNNYNNKIVVIIVIYALYVCQIWQISSKIVRKPLLWPVGIASIRCVLIYGWISLIYVLCVGVIYLMCRRVRIYSLGNSLNHCSNIIIIRIYCSFRKLLRVNNNNHIRCIARSIILIILVIRGVWAMILRYSNEVDEG